MWTRIVCLFLFFSSCSTIRNGCVDAKACEVFVSHLTRIDNSLKSDTDFGQDSSVVFLQNLTKIKSTAGGNFFGRFKPLQKDLENWRDWYETHKSELYWDARDKRVKKEKEK